MQRAGRAGVGLAATCVVLQGAAASWAGVSDLPQPRVALPGSARAAGVSADRATWLVGLRPGIRAEQLARAHRGIPASRPLGSWIVPRSQARRLVGELRRIGSLRYAEPNVLRRPRAVQLDPLMGTPAGYWRSMVVPPSLAPPPAGRRGAHLYIIDSPGDPSHPELNGGGIRVIGDPAPQNGHGTTVASIAAAPSNGQGVTGIWPGGFVTLHGLGELGGDEGLSCGTEVRAIEAAIRAGAKVINMSFGGPGAPCVSESEVMQRVVARDIVPVAAAGNEFLQGNPVEFPAGLPHVITASAVDENRRSSFFSNANAAVDLAAPGENMVAAIPVGLDSDGTRDGYEITAGTSFASPIISTAIAWLRTARPRLTRDQAGQLLKATAEDIDREGFDGNTGFGLINIGRALRARTPANDPGEPNDDIRFVSGRTMGPARAIFGTVSTSRTVRGRIDRQEDPEDVFRVRLAPGRRVRATVTPSFGDPDLEVYRPGSPTVNGNRGLIDRRARVGRDSITFTNRSSRTRAFYVGVFLLVPPEVAADAGYRLTITRLRRR